MPIYQRRVFSVVKPLKGVKSDDNIFTIPHTGEQFKDENEYRDRCELYAQEVWVCQCTGHTGLTHKEAWDSERKIRNMLEASFPEFLHKPILSAVHHSTKALDALIDEALNIIHSRFHKGEAVMCLKQDKARGTVLDVTDPENVCSSPSSDKENKVGQPPATLPNGRFPPSHLPLRYTVQLEQSGRVIPGLPPAELSRAERLPTRDLLRLFIRSSAVRQGSSATAPWVVAAPLFIQHGLKNKIASIFLPSSERKNGMNSSLPPKKRKLIDTSKEKPSKKAKSGGPPRGAPKAPTNGSAPAAVPPDSDSDCEVLANIASSSKTKNVLKVKLSPKKDECRASLSVVLSPEKDKTAGAESDDSDDVKLSVLAKSPIKKLTFDSEPPSVKKSLFGKGSGAGAIGKHSGPGDAKGKERKKKKPKDKERKPKERGKKEKNALQSKKTEGKRRQGSSADGKRSGRTRKTDQKTMRQMSLFDLNKKTAPQASQKAPSIPQKKPTSPQKSPTKRSLPPCVRRLVRQLDAGKKMLPSSSLVKTCAKWLTHQQISLVQHQRARQLIDRSRAKLDEQRLMARMTPAQKEEYLKKKKEEERRARIIESRKVYEDQTLQLAPLPAPSPVQPPTGLPAHLFGEAVMVVEFVHAFSSLLVPAGGAPTVPSDQLLQALAGSRRHNKLLLDVVTMMLKVLLNDGTAEGRRELSTPLRQVPVTPQTASELVRLSLRPADADSDAASDAGDEHEESLSDTLLERLEQCELFELTTAERLDVLHVLVHRLLDTDSVADRHRDVCLRRDAIYRNLKAQRRKEGETTSAASAAELASQPPPPPPPPPPAADQTLEESDDLASRTKRSRRNLEQARREREERERQKRERREREIEAEKRSLAEAAVFREYNSLQAEAARLLRRAPLGTDRHHRRYWLLASLPAALYVEDGWAGRETVEYRVQPRQPTGAVESDEDEQPLKEVQRRCLDEREQVTAPEPAENRWFFYSTVAQVEQLRAALSAKGERESALRSALAANQALIQSSLATDSDPVPEKPSLTQGTVDATHATTAGSTMSTETEATPDGATGTQVNMETDAEPAADAKSGSKSEPDAGTDAESQPDVRAETSLISGTKGDIKSEPDTKTVHPPVGSDDDSEQQTGQQFLISTLKEDILSIEEELSAGWLGAVPDPSGWAERVLSAETAVLLADTVLECERHIRRDVLQGPLGGGADGQTSPGGERWAEAVRSCRTLSRLHVLVGLLDSAIRWDLSTAQKKCRVCRRRGDSPVSLCTSCKQLYHWGCLRPPLLDSPAGEWLCPACRPVQRTETGGRRQRAARTAADDEPLLDEDEEMEEDQGPPKEKECRVCGSTDEDGMIFCTKCPAAFHKTCHEPQMLLRVRPGWECMDCKAPVKKRSRGRISGPPPSLPSALLRKARTNLSEREHREDENMEEEDEVEEEAEAEEQEEEEEEEGPEEKADEDDTDESWTERPKPARKCRARRTRVMLSDDDEDDEPPPAATRLSDRRRRAAPRRSFRQSDSGSEEERRIRALSSNDDEDDEDDERVVRRAGRGSSASRRADVRARCRRQPRKRYAEKSESDLEPSDDGEPAESWSGAAEPPAKQSPSKVEMVQQAGAVCMYCELPSTRRNELAVCQSCPSMYHRRCATAAGLVDAWQCRQCVLPSVYRARPVKPRASEDFEYDE